MSAENTCKQTPPEIFQLRAADMGDKSAITAERTNINTAEGSSIVKDINSSKQLPVDFKSQDGSDIELS